MTKQEIDRINELARKQKTEEGLTCVEQAEQQGLRNQYLKEFRDNMKATLESIRVEQEDGTYAPLQKREDIPKEAIVKDDQPKEDTPT